MKLHRNPKISTLMNTYLYFSKEQINSWLVANYLKLMKNFSYFQFKINRMLWKFKRGNQMKCRLIIKIQTLMDLFQEMAAFFDLERQFKLIQILRTGYYLLKLQCKIQFNDSSMIRFNHSKNGHLMNGFLIILSKSYLPPFIWF